MEGFTRFEKKKKKTTTNKDASRWWMRIDRSARRPVLRKCWWNCLEMRGEKTKFCQFTNTESAHKTGLRFITSVRPIMYERLLFQLGGGREACQVQVLFQTFSVGKYDFFVYRTTDLVLPKWYKFHGWFRRRTLLVGLNSFSRCLMVWNDCKCKKILVIYALGTALEKLNFWNEVARQSKFPFWPFDLNSRVDLN